MVLKEKDLSHDNTVIGKLLPKNGIVVIDVEGHQTGLFLIGHNVAPQKTVMKTKTLHVFHSNRDWQRLVGPIGPGG